VAHPNYIEIVKETLGFDELKNYAQNGICISTAKGPFPSDAMVLKFDKMDKGDTLFISGGTNDYAAAIPLGDGDSLDVNTFIGATRVLFGKARDSYPSDKVYVITPVPRTLDTVNESGHTVDDYREALATLAGEFGFWCIDGRGVAIDPKDEAQREKYMIDGLHPNPEGHRVYAEYVLAEIERMKGEVHRG
jgi:lysophospholipase L1-like esterase